MSNLTKAERDKLPLEDFGDPKRRLYPIKDQDDVDSAASLIGKAQNPDAVKARIISIAKRKGLSIPDAWKSDSAKHSVAAFALEGRTIEGDYVIRTGKLFEAGDYQDKDFTISPEEMQAAVADFTPLPVDLEHVPTLLDGKLGQLRSIEVGEDGWSLQGTVALPKWLDDALEGSERKVSATWDRGTKTLQGLALVRNPRVSDAALMAAFAVEEALQDTSVLEALFAGNRHSTPEGQMAMQEMHDTSARRGAVCKAGNTRQATMASSHEAGALQKIHDLTMEHGAKCSSVYPPSGFPFFSATRRQPRKEGRTMSRFDEFMTWLKGDEGDASAPPAATMSAPESGELKALRERQTALEAENARMRAERISEQAAAFADAQIRERRAFPAERESIVSDYVQRATDDSLLATFSQADANRKSGIESLKATFAVRPAHALNAEGLKPEELAVLMNRSETEGAASKPSSKEQIDAMIVMTPLGKALLGQRNDN